MIPFVFTFTFAEFWKISADFCLVIGSKSELRLQLKMYHGFGLQSVLFPS